VVGEPKSVEDAERLFHQSPFQFERWAVSLVGGESYKGMGGGDSGIDGIIIFKDAEDKYQRIIIEVKGGAYHPKDIRALARVLQREEAPMGILLALQQPTKGMLSEAAGLGKWSMPRANIAYPMLQVFTIKNYFSGKRPNLPISNVTFEKAKRAVREKKERPPRLI